MDYILRILPNMFAGLGVSAQIFLITIVLSLPIGILLALVRISKVAVFRKLAEIYIYVMRGTPLMLQLIVIYYGPGLFLGNNIWGTGSRGRFIAVLAAFIFNYACYFSEIYRGGIESIPVGQYEAANVLGYTRAQTFLRIILPQVVKRIMPSITNEVVTLVKDTSMAFTVSYQEMFTIGKQIANSQTSFMPFLVAGVFYFVFNAIVDFVMGKIEKRMDYYK